jgi:hypothetical protein
MAASPIGTGGQGRHIASSARTRLPLGSIANIPVPHRMVRAGRRVGPVEYDHRAALALRLVLFWLCWKHSSAPLREELVHIANSLVDRVNRQRPSTLAEAERWRRCYTAVRSEHAGDSDLAGIRAVEAVLMDIDADVRLVNDARTQGTWVRCGQMAAALWQFEPFGRGAVSERSREVLASLVQCSRAAELRSRVTASLAQHSCHGMERSLEVRAFVDLLRDLRYLFASASYARRIGQGLMTISDQAYAFAVGRQRRPEIWRSWE